MYKNIFYYSTLDTLQSSTADGGHDWNLLGLEPEDLDNGEDDEHGHEKGDDGLEDAIDIECWDRGGADSGDKWQDTLTYKDASEVQGCLGQEETNSNTSHILILDKILERQDEFVVHDE